MTVLSTRPKIGAPLPGFRRCLALAMTAAIGWHAPAWAAPMHCPDQIKVEQRAVQLPAGVQAFDREPQHNWTNAEFSDGPPNEQAWLAPDDTKKSGASFTNIWRFTPAKSGTWLACGYTGTSLVVVSRLPDSVRTCEVRFDANTSPPTATAVDCR